MTGGRQLCDCPRAPPITRRVPVKGRMTAGKINQPPHHTLSSPLYLIFKSRKVSELCEGSFSGYSWHAHTVNNETSKHVHFSRYRTEKKDNNKKLRLPIHHTTTNAFPTSLLPFNPSPHHNLPIALSESFQLFLPSRRSPTSSSSRHLFHSTLSPCCNSLSCSVSLIFSLPTFFLF